MPTAPPDRLRAARVQALRAYEAARTRSLDDGDDDALAEKLGHLAALEVFRAARIRPGRGGVLTQLRLAGARVRNTASHEAEPIAVERIEVQPSRALLDRFEHHLTEAFRLASALTIRAAGPPRGQAGFPIRAMTHTERREP